MRRLLDSRGFTLLEVMIAMTIMLVAFASILSVQSSSLNTSAKARQMNLVGMLAKSALVQTEVEMQGKAFKELGAEESGQFEEPYQEYTWERTIKEVKFPNLSALLSSQPSGEAAASEDGNAAMMEQMSKLVTNFLSKALREVTITVKWRKGAGEQKYVVSMYWVDLNSDFQLSP